MGFIIDFLIDFAVSLLSWRHLLILLFIVALGYCIYEFLLPLFGASP
jgi:hypothetical protein